MSRRPHPLVTGLAAGLEPVETAVVGHADSPGEHAHLADQRPPDLIILRGYLGDLVHSTTDDNDPWRVLYLNSELESWLMVRESSILLHDRTADETAAFGQRDAIWVAADAETHRGNAPPAKVVESEFLAGDFTRASDYAASLYGLSGPAQTGVFCGQVTPACMAPKRRP